MAPSQKRAYVSPETAEQLADLRLEVSRREGRVVSTDFVVVSLIEAGKREERARVAYEAIKHEYENVMRDIDKTLSIGASNYAKGLKLALDLMGE